MRDHDVTGAREAGSVSAHLKHRDALTAWAHIDGAILDEWPAGAVEVRDDTGRHRRRYPTFEAALADLQTRAAHAPEWWLRRHAWVIETGEIGLSATWRGWEDPRDVAAAAPSYATANGVGTAAQPG